MRNPNHIRIFGFRMKTFFVLSIRYLPPSFSLFYYTLKLSLSSTISCRAFFAHFGVVCYCVTPRSQYAIYSEYKFDFAPFGLLCTAAAVANVVYVLVFASHTRTLCTDLPRLSSICLGLKHYCRRRRSELIFCCCCCRSLCICDAAVFELQRDRVRNCLLYLFRWRIIFICHSFTVDSIWNIY